MKSRSELINYLIDLRGLRDYCEIGVFNRDHNFNKIDAIVKVCVDPDPNAKADFIGTSDKWFETFNELGVVAHHDKSRFIKTFDIFFIDGLHHADQVKKDFDNALSVLNDNGFIVMHDCKPPTEKTTCIPRGAQREWCGDVYKFASSLSEYAGINFVTVDMDYGCCVVWKDSRMNPSNNVGEVTWERFEKEKELLLRLISPEQIELIPGNELYESETASDVVSE